MYLFLRDAKLLLRDPLIDKLYIYKVYLLLRNAKLLMRDAIYKYSVPPSEGYQTPSEQRDSIYKLRTVKNKHVRLLSLLRDANFLLSF